MVKIPRRFHDGQPHSVEIINESNQRPITPGKLVVTIGPELAGHGHDEQAPLGAATFDQASGSRGKRMEYSWRVSSQAQGAGLKQELKEKRKLAVVAAWSNQRTFLSCHRDIVSDLKSMGFAVVLVHATDRQDEWRTCSEIEGLDCLIDRPNQGYDFGSWATGILHCADVLNDLDEVILVNDSAFGRIAPLEPRLSACSAPFVCLTDSYQVSHHGQSYFLRFGREPLESGAVLDFFEKYPFTNKKRDVIRNGEIGLSAAMLDGGFGIHPLFPYEQVAARWIEHAPSTVDLIKDSYRDIGLYGSKTMERRLDSFAAHVESVLRNVPLNPSHLFWRTLISEHGFPLIKRELLLKNPIGVADLFPMKSAHYLEAIGADHQVVEYLARHGDGPLIQCGKLSEHEMLTVN